MKFKFKRYLYIANDITSALLNKEKRREDNRVKNLTTILIVVVVIMLVSLFFNIYLVTGA
ncbi:MAG: hypothetical protein Q8Q23_06525 [bacterium]|nr:hypothetical protein [bacterium]